MKNSVMNVGDLDVVALIDEKTQKLQYFDHKGKTEQKTPHGSHRKYVVPDISQASTHELYIMGVWSNILKSAKYLDVVHGFSNLKRNRKVLAIDFDKILVRSRKIVTEGYDCGTFDIRLDLSFHYRNTVLAKPHRGTTKMGNYNARHPHIYNTGSVNLMYPDKLHVCLGEIKNPYSYSIDRADFEEALDIIEVMLDETKWDEGMTVCTCTCDDCGDVFFNQRVYEGTGIGICPECKT